MHAKSLLYNGFYPVLLIKPIHRGGTAMNKSFFRHIVCAFASLALIAGAGCSKKPELIRIGAILPLTGSEAEVANQNLHGLVLAVEELNAANPNVVFELVADNDQNDWNVALAAFKRQLMEKKIVAEFATTRTSCLAVVPEAEKEFVPIFANCSHPLMTVMHINAFRNFPSTAMEVRKIADFVSVSLKLESIALLFSDDDYGKDAETAIKGEFAQRGIQIIAAKPFGGAGAEPIAATTEILSQKPDAIYVYGHGKAAADVLTTLRTLGYRGIILGSYDFSEPAFAALPKGSLEGCYYPMLNIELTGNKTFADKYQKRFKVAPTANSIIAYDAMLIMGKAAVTKRAEKISITNALKKVGNFSGAAGDYEYVDREWLPPLRIVRVLEGKVQLVN
jgi:branched-chain amino acid transport system substrate-binding protein